MQQVEHRTSRRSFVAEVADALRDQIEAGFYAPGDKLPTEPRAYVARVHILGGQVGSLKALGPCLDRLVPITNGTER